MEHHRAISIEETSQVPSGVEIFGGTTSIRHVKESLYFSCLSSADCFEMSFSGLFGKSLSFRPLRCTLLVVPYTSVVSSRVPARLY